MTLKLCMQYWVLDYYQVCSNDDPELTLTYFLARSNLVPYAFVWEKGKTMDFSETFVVYDVKVGWCSKLNQYMNLYEYQRSRSFIDLHPRSLWFKFSNFFSLETFRPIEARFHVEPPWDRGMKVYSNGLCHMTNMAAMPIHGKNLKKSSSLEPKGQLPWKFVCSIRYSSTSKFIQMMTLSWPWPILGQGQIWSLMLLYGKRVK